MLTVKSNTDVLFYFTKEYVTENLFLLTHEYILAEFFLMDVRGKPSS